MNGSPKLKILVYPKIIHGWISMNVLKMMEEMDQATKGNEVHIKKLHSFLKINVVYEF